MILIKSIKRIAAQEALKFQRDDYKNKLPYDSLAYFPEFNLLFNRIKKSGNTSAVLRFHDIAGGDMSLDPEKIKNLRSIKKLPFKTLYKSNRFTKLAIVRDPAARILSGFLDKVGPGDKKEFSCYPGYGNPNQETFEEFLIYLRKLTYRCDPHFYPQIKLMVFDPRDFDFLLRLENLSIEILPVLETLGLDKDLASTFAKPHVNEIKLNKKITNSISRLKMISDKAENIIYDIFGEDYKVLNYTKSVPR